MPQYRPFRFGCVRSRQPSRESLLDQARMAEALGYSTFLLPEHLIETLSPLPALMAVADATQTLRVGSCVLVNDFRHPVMLARDAATLDLLSGGRLELGLGAGWLPVDYTQTGIPFEPPSVRVDRLTETVHIIKGLFAADPLTFSGRHYTITDLIGQPRPVQSPHPPLLIAGAGRRMLSLAAQQADIVGLTVTTREGRVDLADGSAQATARRLEWVRQAAGERMQALELNTVVFSMVVTDHRQQAADELANVWGVTSEQLLDTVHILVGSVDQITEEVQRWREQFGLSYIVVAGQASITAFAPVVARLAGT